MQALPATTIQITPYGRRNNSRGSLSFGTFLSLLLLKQRERKVHIYVNICNDFSQTPKVLKKHADISSKDTMKNLEGLWQSVIVLI